MSAFHAAISALAGDNESGPRRCDNTTEGLTHSSDLSREGLGMQPTRVCRSCGGTIPFNTKLGKAKYATRTYCNNACRLRGPDITSDYIVTKSGCWEWQGRADKNGYGKAYDPTRPVGKRVDWAHRVSYRRHVGEIPPQHELDHTCENIICINPQHLDPVTKVEHARRTMERLGKDRLHSEAAQLRVTGLTYGEIAEVLKLGSASSAHAAVQAAIRKGLVDPAAVPPVRHLDEADRADIAALYALGVPQTEIAAWYGTDSSNVSRICSGKPRVR